MVNAIEDRDCWIIRKGNEYLTAYIPELQSIRFSLYAWDAARIYSDAMADIVAQKIGGKPVRFNTVLGIRGEMACGGTRQSTEIQNCL